MTIQWLKLTTEYCECWLGTIQWLQISIVLISNSAHFELSRDSWTTVSLITMIKNTIMKFLWLPMERVNVSVRDLLTVFVPYFVNIAFLFLSIVSCVQSWDIHIKLTICIVLPHTYCNIVLCKMHLNNLYCIFHFLKSFFLENKK